MLIQLDVLELTKFRLPPYLDGNCFLWGRLLKINLHISLVIKLMQLDDDLLTMEEWVL